MKLTHRQIFGYFGLSALILLLDQISKWAVTETMIKPALAVENTYGFFEWYGQAQGQLPPAAIDVLPFFNIVMVWNRGVSFGMLTQDTALGSWLLVGLSVVITVWFTGWLFFAKSRLQRLGIAMVIGGAIGNAIDRIRFNGVIDFLDFHAFGWHYPAFNVADSCIVVGVFMLIIYAVFLEKSFHS
ncbi:MAG: signal peptidase II [Alphaproteobacteria bacterium]|nr:signal peptidase II [Alphaproteobacteria bacterium]